MATIAPRWKGRLDPDGRFAVWPERGLKRSEFSVSKEKAGDRTSQTLRTVQAEVQRQIHDLIAGGMPPGLFGVREYLEEREHQRAMDSPKLINSEKQRAPRGSTGITPHGRRKVRCGIGLMEFRCKTRNMSLYTGTFPTMSREEWESVAYDWSRGVDAFLRGIAYYLKKAGIRPSFVGCVELQEKRLAKSGELGLHLHVVFQGRVNSKRDWAITPGKCHEIWRKTWERHAPTAQHWCAGNKLEAIVSSASAYLGKYLSKGCAAITRAREANELERIVPSWYVCSREISRWVEMATACSSTVGDYLRQILRERSKDVVFSGVILREIADGRVVVVSGYGQTVYRNWSQPPPWVGHAKIAGTSDLR